jgi:hypothetical protein
MGDRKTALFREVNESMNQLLFQFGADEQADFFCECPLRECTRRVSMTRIEYDGVRRTGGFLVSPFCRRWPGVVLRTERYAVVADFRTRLGAVTESTEPSPSEPGRGEGAGGPGSSPTAAPDSRAAA